MLQSASDNKLQTKTLSQSCSPFCILFTLNKSYFPQYKGNQSNATQSNQALVNEAFICRRPPAARPSWLWGRSPPDLAVILLLGLRNLFRREHTLLFYSDTIHRLQQQQHTKTKLLTSPRAMWFCIYSSCSLMCLWCWTIIAKIRKNSRRPRGHGGGGPGEVFCSFFFTGSLLPFGEYISHISLVVSPHESSFYGPLVSLYKSH